MVADSVEVGFYPFNKFTGIAGIFEHKHRRTLHGITHDSGLHTAAQVQQFNPSIIRSNERSFGGG